MEATQLNALQRQLEGIYEVPVGYDVGDFVITDPQLAQQLDDSHNARLIDEKLLIKQCTDSLDLALYLDAELAARLAADDPLDYLHNGNLVDFCTALEGVSHFLYLTWNAGLGRGVSQLELELQAEIDKYIVIANLFGQQRSLPLPEQLHRWLFEHVRFDTALTEDELERYRDANRFAGKYCLQLETRYLRLRDHRGSSLLNELRRFYRLPFRDKIRRIQTMN